MRLRNMIPVLLLTALVASACTSGSETLGGGSETTEGVPPLAAETTTTEAEETITEVGLMAPLPEGGGTFDPDARPLTVQFQALEGGTYLVETLGTPFSVTVPEGWWVQPNEGGWTVVTHPLSQGPGDRDIVFIRPTDLFHPEDSTEWPVGDLAGWLSSIVEGVVVGEPAETTLGDWEATVFDIRLQDDFGEVLFVENGEVSSKSFRTGIDYRVFWVDQGEFAPIAVVVGSGVDGQEFIEAANTVLETVAFGEPAEHPVDPNVPLWEQGISAEVPAGTVRLPVGGGLEFELGETRFVSQESNVARVLMRVEGEIDILAPVSTPDGMAIESASDAVAALETVSTITELEPVLVDGLETRVFDLTGGPPTAEIAVVISSSAEDPTQGWRAPPLARIWLIESEEGLLMVTAESYGGEEVWELAIELAESIVGSLEFIDIGE